MAQYDYRYFHSSAPRKAKGGIRAQSGRGGFGRNWWARRWIEVLEGFDIGARLSRGRSYARQGQVLSIDVDEGVVTARVQGSRSRPYLVRIRIETLDGADRDKLAGELLARPVFAAKLLAGQMPEDIEDLFRDAGLSLFPDSEDGLETDCSCPDWTNPCKHIVAVYLLLGEEFDRDPFLVFKLRGADWRESLGLDWRESLGLDWRESLGLDGRDAESSGFTATETATGPLDDPRSGQSLPEPLPVDLAEFWRGGNTEPEEDADQPARIPPVSAALPKRLGSFPFWRSEESFIPALEEIYRRASRAGLNVFLRDGRP